MTVYETSLSDFELTCAIASLYDYKAYEDEEGIVRPVDVAAAKRVLCEFGREYSGKNKIRVRLQPEERYAIIRAVKERINKNTDSQAVEMAVFLKISKAKEKEEGDELSEKRRRHL